VLTATGVVGGTYSVGPTGYSFSVDNKGRLSAIVANGNTMLLTTTPVTSSTITGTGLTFDLNNQFGSPLNVCGGDGNSLCTLVANQYGIVTYMENMSSAFIFNSSQAAASSPTFTGLTLTGVTANALLYMNGVSAVTGLTLNDGQLAIGRSGSTPVAATLTAGAGSSRLFH